MVRIAATLAACVIATCASADQYDYEVGGGYQRSESDFSDTFSTGSARGSSDTDIFNLAGTWYFAGLTDDEGPRSRAAFLSRASNLTIAFARSDGSSRFTFTDPILPPVTARSDTESDNYSATLRHVRKQSGWYGLAGISRLETDIRALSDGPTISEEADATLYSLGAGKYLGKATSLDLNVSRVDADLGDTTNYALTLAHVGNLGESWQYGLDVSVSQSDQDDDDGTYGARFALFPTRDFEFGIGVTHRDVGSIDGQSYDVFVSWFPRPNIGLNAGYTEDKPDEPSGQSSDSSSSRVGISVRF